MICFLFIYARDKKGGRKEEWSGQERKSDFLYEESLTKYAFISRCANSVYKIFFFSKIL